jgi:hypothetical protein
MILKNEKFLTNISKIIDDMINILNKPDILYIDYEIIKKDKLTLYINKEYKLRLYNNNNIQTNIKFDLELENLLYYQGLSKELNITDIKELYENKDYKFINEMSDKEAYDFIIHYYNLCYNKEYYNNYINKDKIDKIVIVYKNIFKNLKDTLKYNLLLNNISILDYISDINNIQTILKYILLVESDYKYKEENINCSKINVDK